MLNDSVLATHSVNDPIRLALLRAEARRQAFHAEGDFIEMGVYRGGTALLLAEALRQWHPRGRLDLLDSWQGMPKPTFEDGAALIGEGFFADASEAAVRQLLQAHGLLDLCTTHAGWFEDTLPALRGPFSFAHVDCDYYAPVLFCLRHLLPRMTARGTIVIDDYGSEGPRSFPGVARAVHQAVEGTSWQVLPLGGARDQSVILLRGPEDTDAVTLI